jgi:hypothetical protein
MIKYSAADVPLAGGVLAGNGQSLGGFFTGNSSAGHVQLAHVQVC